MRAKASLYSDSNSGPAATNTGCNASSIKSTMPRSRCGQVSIAPSDVFDQSTARIRSRMPAAAPEAPAACGSCSGCRPLFIGSPQPNQTAWSPSIGELPADGVRVHTHRRRYHFRKLFGWGNGVSVIRLEPHSSAAARAAWAVLNVLQLIYTIGWTAACICAALLVRLAGGDRTNLPLRMASRLWAPGLLHGAMARLRVEGRSEE